MEKQEAQLKLLEPLRELYVINLEHEPNRKGDYLSRSLTRHSFKDEVRAFGRQLTIDEELVGRHPFPGPGLGIRVLGSVDREKIEIVRQADHIFISEIRKAGIYDEVRCDHPSYERTFAKEIF